MLDTPAPPRDDPASAVIVAAGGTDETETIAILSLPKPTVWLQLKLLAPASTVLALETASKPIGNVAGFVTFVLSIVIDLR
jgi:hypothetical protein